MFRVYADRVVTFMKNVQSFIKLTMLKLVANPVGGSVLTIEPKLTVKTRLATSSLAKPLPAFIGSFSVYFRPITSYIRLFHTGSISQSRGVI
jgi:hypothetical protein